MKGHSRDAEASLSLWNQNDFWAWVQREAEGDGGRQGRQVEGEETGSGPGGALGTTGARQVFLAASLPGERAP